MKTLSILFILCLSLTIVDKTNSVFGYEETAGYLFMQPNSTAHIYMKFGSTITDNETKYKGILDVITRSPPSDVSITDIPSVMTNGSTIVDYKITAKNNVKGMYGIPLGNCGLNPLVIGLDENEINASLFVKSFLQALPCATYDPARDGIVYSKKQSVALTEYFGEYMSTPFTSTDWYGIVVLILVEG